MFNLFGPDPDKLNEAFKKVSTTSATLIQLLIEKGVFTAKEFEDTQARISALADQQWARKKEEAQAEFDKKYPGLSKLVGGKNPTDT